MIDWLNDNSGAVQAISVVVLAIVTAVYAISTMKISNATTKQAAASVRMTEEMREQRLSSDRPILVIGFPKDEWLKDEEHSLAMRVFNSGRGAAVSVAAAYFRPPLKFRMIQSGSLLSGETWNVVIPSEPEEDHLEERAWVKQLIPELSNARTEAHAITLYKDIHGRAWVTALEIDWQPEDETLTVGAQKFIRLQDVD